MAGPRRRRPLRRRDATSTARIVDPDAFVRTNCDGTNVLCDVARQVGVERFLHISTDEVYGSIDDGRFTETDPLTPRSPYSAAKAGSRPDRAGLPRRPTACRCVVTRCSNQYGPYQFPEKVIPLFVTNLLDGGKVPLYGDGRQRPRLDVRPTTTCARVDLVLRQGTVGEIYNIGAAQRVHQPRADRTGCSTLRHGRALHRARRGPARATTAATRSRPTRSPRSAGRRRTTFDDALDETIGWYRRQPRVVGAAEAHRVKNR